MLVLIRDIKVKLMKISILKYTRTIQILLFIYLIGFGIGTTTHILDLVNGGFLPYSNYPMWKNIFWTSLTFLDFLAIILILTSIKPALILSNLIMISDVLINTNGLHDFDYYKLILQTIFGVYVILSTLIILIFYKKSYSTQQRV